MYSQREKSIWALFLIWPFMAMICAFFFKVWSVDRRNIIWAFTVFFGLTFAIGDESRGSDINRYLEELQILHSNIMGLHEAFNYYIESGELDILRTMISYIVSRFTDSQSVLTAVYGIIFGFFFSRNICFVLDRIDSQRKFLTIILILCLFLIVPIWNINGFRFWTAAHIFFYGVIPYLWESNRSRLAFSVLSVLVHFAFLVPIGVLFIYLLIGNRLSLYFIFFISSFLFSEFDSSLFSNELPGLMPSKALERTESYLDQNKIELFRQDSKESEKVWYAVWYRKTFTWALAIILMFLFVYERIKIQRNKHILASFSFVLLFFGMANFLTTIPSGVRFIVVSNFITVSFILLNSQVSELGLRFKKVMHLLIPVFLFFIVISLRIGLYSTSVATVLGNPITTILLLDENLSLNDIIK